MWGFRSFRNPEDLDKETLKLRSLNGKEDLMGNKLTWMWAVQEEQLKELDLLSVGSGLSRPDFARKVLAQGLLLEKHLQSEGMKTVAQQLQQTSGQSEPKASTPQGQKSEAPVAPTPQKNEKPTAPAGPPKIMVGNTAVIFNLPPPSSPAKSVSAPPPTSGASKPVDASEAILESPFDCLNDDYQDPDKLKTESLDEFIEALSE